MATLDKQDLVLNFTSMDDLNELISKLADLEELHRDLINLRDAVTIEGVKLHFLPVGLTPREAKMVEGLLNA